MGQGRPGDTVEVFHELSTQRTDFHIRGKSRESVFTGFLEGTMALLFLEVSRVVSRGPGASCTSQTAAVSVLPRVCSA